MKPRQIIALTLLVVALLLTGALPAQAQSGRQVWVMYMGFWGGGPSWDWQASVLSDYPLIGRYDSRDPGIVGTQIDQAKSAGIDAFLVTWFGAGETATTTPVLNNVLDRAAERGFHAGAVVDIFNPAFNRSREEIVASLNYLIYDRANHPGYLRYNGKPVIFFAFQDRAGFSDAQWQSIRSEVDPNRSTIWIAEGIGGCCLYGGAMDGMYAFNLAWANGSAARFQSERNAVTARGGTLYVPTVHPGWNEDLIAAREGRPNPTSPRDRLGGQFLTNSWNGAVSAGTDVILIVSWNEFMENSHIEPSQLYGTQSLDVLRPLIAAWEAGSGGAASPPPVAGPAAGSTLQAKITGLNVRSGPGTTYAPIGQINPGTPFAITGQQGSWYAIDYFGQTGWVAGWLVTTSGAAAAPAAPITPPTASSTLQAKIAGLNVRSGPGTSYTPIGQISPGTSFAINGQQGSWYSINYYGQTGWVAGWLVSTSGGGDAPGSSAVGHTLQAKIIGLNVRSGPGTTYSILGQINPGTPFAITGQQGNWYSIAYSGQTGWVAGWLVTRGP